MHFSVLMSLYLKEKAEYFSMCLQSIYDQSVSATEVIIVEDGPLTSELYEVLDCWELKLPIKRIVLESNLGLGRALNEGLKHCTNDIVARMDTDDICDLTRFEKQLSIIMNNDIDVCGSWVSEFDKSPNVIESTRVLPEFHAEIEKFSYLKNPMNHPSVMYRIDKVKSVGGYDDVLFFEDYFLWLKLISSGAIFYNIQEPLVNMRAGLNQLSRRSGFSYATYEFKFLLKSWHFGFFSFFQFSRNTILRVPLRLFPSFILKRIYQVNRK